MSVILFYLPVFGSLWFSPITYLEMIYKSKGAKGYKNKETFKYPWTQYN